MASLTFNPNMSGQGQYLPTSAVGALSSTFLLGQSFPTTFPTYNLGTGTALTGNVIQIADWYLNQATITSGTTLSINLNGGSDANPFGAALTWTKLKLVLISLVAPNGTNKIQIGPQGVSNAAQLWFGGVTSVCVVDEYYTMFKAGPPAGWTITPATAMLFNIKNPNAGSVNVSILLGGGT